MGREVVHVYRGEYVESIHYGSVAVVNFEGKLLKSYGEPDFKTFIRSSAKPIQALPVIFSGAAEKYHLTPAELAVMCASHNGEDIHVETVRSILQKIHVPEEKLSCGVHPPYYKPSVEALIRESKEPTAIYCNCSGKHSAMLTLCKYYGWDLDTYIQIDHPVQQMMIDVMSEVTTLPRNDFWLGVDGCGVPVFGMALHKMAYGFARFAKPEVLPEKLCHSAQMIAKAMYTNPMLIAGTNRFCTDLMTVMKGQVIAKAGAEAVYCVGFLEKGIGLTVKIDDGGARGKELVVLKVMEDLGLINEEELSQLKKWRYPLVKNHHGMVIGELKPVFKLE